MFLRPEVIRKILLASAIAASITCILLILIFIPSITEGPHGAHFLERGHCIKNNITYIDNLCPRDTSNDFTNLRYQEDWTSCIVARFNISSDIRGINCTWNHPGIFESQQEAFIAVRQDYKKHIQYERR